MGGLPSNWDQPFVEYRPAAFLIEKVAAVSAEAAPSTTCDRVHGESLYCRPDKRVLGMIAAILASLHMQTTDDRFGALQGSPRTEKLVEASIQWAEKITEEG